MNRLKHFLLHPRLPLFAAALSLFLGLPFLGLGFQVDDYLHRAVFLQPDSLGDIFGSPATSLFSFADGNPERTGIMVDRGMAPWFTLPELRIQYARPLTVATHALDYALWPDSAALMHLHSLLWFGAAVFLVALLYRRFMGPSLAAGIATILFAIDDAHALPAGWIANRNSPVALVLGATVLILHDRWRREGKNAQAPLSVMLFAAALFAREGAIAITAYLFAYAVFLDQAPVRRRILSLMPYAVVALGWRIWHQWAGFGAFGSSALIDPLDSPLAFIRAVAYRAPLFLNGLFALPPSEFHTFSPPSAQPGFVVWSVLVLVVLLPFILRIAWKDRVSRFWALGMLLAVIPICSTGPMDRLLDFAGIGAMGLLGRVFAVMWEDPPDPSRPWARRGSRLLTRSLFTIHVVLAPLLFVGMMFLFAFGSRLAIDAVDTTLTKERDLSKKTVVLSNAANYPIGLYLFLFRGLEGRPVPKSVRSLAAPSMATVPMEVTRIGETALRVDYGDAFGPSLFRKEPDFAVGDRFDLHEVSLEILELNPDGWPRTVVFDFGVPLEDSSLVWLEVQPKGVRIWKPPSAGLTSRLNETAVLSNTSEVEPANVHASEAAYP